MPLHLRLPDTSAAALQSSILHRYLEAYGNFRIRIGWPVARITREYLYKSLSPREIAFQRQDMIL